MLRLNLNNNNKFNIINKLLIIYAKNINIQIRYNKHIQIYKANLIFFQNLLSHSLNLIRLNLSGSLDPFGGSQSGNVFTKST